MILFIFFISAMLLSSESKDILFDIYNKTNWKIIDTKDGKDIFEAKNSFNNDKFLKIEYILDSNQDNIFNTIQSIDLYDQIISNKNISTELLYNQHDTLYCLQRISNSIPFIRDRQYVFKLYKINENRIDWYLMDENNSLLTNYLNDKLHTLTYGAGSWEIEMVNGRKVLIYRMYVNEEVNLPLVFIQNFRINHVIDIFNDVLTWSEGVK